MKKRYTEQQIIGFLRAGDTGLMRRILDSGVLVFLGTISFSLYLWHRLALEVMGRLRYFGELEFVPKLLQPWLTFLAAVGLALVSYTCIERPVQKWRSRRPPVLGSKLL